MRGRGAALERTRSRTTHARGSAAMSAGPSRFGRVARSAMRGLWPARSASDGGAHRHWTTGPAVAVVAATTVRQTFCFDPDPEVINVARQHAENTHAVHGEVLACQPDGQQLVGGGVGVGGVGAFLSNWILCYI